MTETLESPPATAPATRADLLHVLHSSPVWLPRTQTWMHTQLRHLAPDVASHVVCDRVEHLETFPVDSLYRPSPLGRQLDRVARALGFRRHFGPAARARRETGARLLHSHFGHIGWCDLAFARRAGLRHVVTFYGQDVIRLPRVEPEWRARYRELFAAVDRVLCEGPHMAASIAALGCPERKITVHHLGVELDRFRFVDRARRPGDPLRVLICATFTEKKGIPDALAALSRLALTHDVQVTVIGDATADPATGRIKQRIFEAAARDSLTDRVRFLGFQHPARVLALAYEHDVFLHPSRHAADGDCEGGAPVALIEMAATGLPIVSTRHCDIPAVIPEGSGWLADEGDVNGLFDALAEVAAAPDAALVRARAARMHLENEYDAVRQGRALAAIYREVVG